MMFAAQRFLRWGLVLVAGTVISFAPLTSWAQSADRVLGRVDVRERVQIRDHHPSWASPQNDAGAVPSDLRLEHLTLILARSPEVQQAFDQFLANQQNPASSDYHNWLTPAQVGERFGVSLQDFATVAQWLKSQNLQVDSLSESRVRVTFSGPASAVGNAFGANMRYYNVNGKQRISINAEPQIPAALAPVIQGIHGLYTIENRPMHGVGAGQQSSNTVTPELTTTGGNHYIAPADFAVIYDVNSVYNSGINGAGQTIAVVGRARVYNPDIENFQFLANLPTKDPIVVVPPTGVDPGPAASTGGASADQLEATLDVTRAGSVAPGANILLVISANSGGGIATAAEYLVETPSAAQVMNISFGACEASAGQAGVNFWNNIFSQAAAEGISVFVCSGDSGVAGCDPYFATPPANQIASPNYICSSPYATCVGGTQFADTLNPSQYWASRSGSSLQSALSYIPEGGWNEPTNSHGATQTASSGGGVSAYIPTPVWQGGTGVPAARSGRYTPDVSFSSSAHDGYFGCLAAEGNGCVIQNGGYTFEYFFGTSASSPSMAGVAALLNQKQGGRQGNLNPVLYRLAANFSNVFHDVTIASSGVANCSLSTPSMCNNSTPSPTGLAGGLAGYSVGTGFDLVTGLGSVDVANFMASWATVGSLPAPTSTKLNVSPNPAINGSYVTLTATVTPSSSMAPTGTVIFDDGTTSLGQSKLNRNGVATFATTLSVGQHSLTAAYGGDTYNAGSLSASVTETIQSSATAVPVVTSLSPSNAAAGSGPIVLNVNGSNFISTSTVLWNGSGRATSFIDSTQLQATITANDLATVGDVLVQVNNSAGDNSNVTTFTVSPLALRFIPLTPCRVADTRNPNGPLGGPYIAGHASRSFPVPTSGCAGLPATAAAYSLNVTALPRTGVLGYVSIWPDGLPQPFVSTLNSLDGRIKANAAIVPAGTAGAVNLYATDDTDIVLDINGYFDLASNSSAFAFYPVTPCRIADTRNAAGTFGGPSLAARQTRNIPITAGGCAIPSNATAYSLNVTAVPQGTLGYLTIWPAGQPQPFVSTLNAPTGTITANAAIVPAGSPDGGINLWATNTTDVVVGINGYFGPPTSGGLSLYALPPCRVQDTRLAFGQFVGSLTVDTTASACGVIANAQAVVLNATVVPSVAPFGYLTLWPSGQAQPFVSTLNSLDGQLASNMALVPTTSGVIGAYASDPTQLVLDTIGYFSQ